MWYVGLKQFFQVESNVGGGIKIVVFEIFGFDSGVIVKFFVDCYIVIGVYVVEDEIDYVDCFLMFVGVGFDVGIVVKVLWCDMGKDEFFVEFFVYFLLQCFFNMFFWFYVVG